MKGLQLGHAHLGIWEMGLGPNALWSKAQLTMLWTRKVYTLYMNKVRIDKRIQQQFKGSDYAFVLAMLFIFKKSSIEHLILYCLLVFSSPTFFSGLFCRPKKSLFHMLKREERIDGLALGTQKHNKKVPRKLMTLIYSTVANGSKKMKSLALSSRLKYEKVSI